MEKKDFDLKGVKILDKKVEVDYRIGLDATVKQTIKRIPHDDLKGAVLSLSTNLAKVY